MLAQPMRNHQASNRPSGRKRGRRSELRGRTARHSRCNGHQEQRHAARARPELPVAARDDGRDPTAATSRPRWRPPRAVCRRHRRPDAARQRRSAVREPSHGDEVEAVDDHAEVRNEDERPDQPAAPAPRSTARKPVASLAGRAMGRGPGGAVRGPSSAPSSQNAALPCDSAGPCYP